MKEVYKGGKRGLGWMMVIIRGGIVVGSCEIWLSTV